MKTCSKTRALFSFYVSTVFGLLVTLEQISVSQFSLWPYSLILALYLGTFFLPIWNPFKDEALQRILMFANMFWTLALVAWALGPGIQIVINHSELYAYLSYFIIYGGFFGIVEGVYIIPVVPAEKIEDSAMGYSGAVEYLRYEDEKWWRGLNMLWPGIMPTFVPGIINWTTQGTTSLAFFLTFSSVPGIAMIVWYVIEKTNAIHERIREIYEAKNKRQNEGQTDLSEL